MDNNTGFEKDHIVAPGLSFDVVIAGDMRVASEAAFRTIHQTKIQKEAGYRTGLLHIPSVTRQVFSFINPEIDLLARTRQATAIDPSTRLVSTRLLLVESPIALCDMVAKGQRLDIPRIVAEQALIVLDEALPIEKLKQCHAIIASVMGSNSRWIATSADARMSLIQADLPHEETIWRVSVSTSGSGQTDRSNRSATVIGRTAFATSHEWPSETSEALTDAYPVDRDDRVMRVLGLPWLSKSALEVPDGWRVMTLRHISSFAFLRSLDYFVYFPGDSSASVPGHAMAWAMAHGVPVIADTSLRGLLGKGPIYAEPEDVDELIDKQGEEFSEQVEACTQFARRNFGPQIHLQRLDQLIGQPQRPAFNVVRRSAQKRVLFTCTNGMGIGHVTRLIAVARRLPKDVLPIFAILSPAAKLVRQAGYPVEYLPSAGSALCDAGVWNDWLRDDLLRIMDFHDVQGMVFDGGHPYQGVMSAMRARPQMKNIWMRRGLWREEQVNDQIIARQHYFDLIVEPGDIAESSDRGATVEHRNLVLSVDPVQLLDDSELLDRPDAAKALGLDPSKPSCLVQLGAGFNRDQASLMEGTISALQAVKGMQIVVAKWPISSQDTDYWPDTVCLRSFPSSKYYNAFDFTVSATGYNSFHEIITFGLPAIFMANSYTGLDDQAARAEFAQQNDAGFHLPETRVDAIGRIIESIMDEQTQMIIRSNCLRISRQNGAQQAANAVADLVA